jgi:AraC-like DNA-binding protein
MNKSLQKHVQISPGLARQNKWCVDVLAKQRGVSARTLRRRFLKTVGINPKQWLTDQRFKLAEELLLMGASVKETAAQVGYQYSETFSREFKKHCGKCPFEVMQTAAGEPPPR